MTTYVQDNDGKYKLFSLDWNNKGYVVEQIECNTINPTYESSPNEHINQSKQHATSKINDTFLNLLAGKYIAASQRPDGTWRKARRVKDGYVPQEEVPLYESKGKQFMKKPDLPVGMCPIIAQQTKQKRDKQKQQQAAKIPGLIILPSASSTNGTIPTAKKDGKTTKSNSNAATTTSGKKSTNKSKVNDTKAEATVATTTINSNAVCAAVASMSLSNEQDLSKQLKKLRKKIRDIEAIEERLQSGTLKNPEKDQLDKVARKPEILRELHELEKFETRDGIGA